MPGRANLKTAALVARLTGLAESGDDVADIAQAVASLETEFGLSRKVSNEPETLAIIEQLLGRVLAAFGPVSQLKGKRILDIGCGSRTSRAPSRGFRGGRERPSREGYTALFEPWFCRILTALGAGPVGVDIGDLGGEPFEHYQADLGHPGALDFLPERSFDAVHDSRLFGSPEFTARFHRRAEALRIAREIVHQERRVLKEEGIIIHSDAHELIQA